jgi:hypothetical protein
MVEVPPTFFHLFRNLAWRGFRTIKDLRHLDGGIIGC